MTVNESLGKKLKLIRQEKGLTQIQLADICGISQAQITRYEKGRNEPSRRVLEQISKGLGVPIEFFSDITEVAISSLDADYERLRDSLSDPEDKLVLSKILKSLYLTTQTKIVYNDV